MSLFGKEDGIDEESCLLIYDNSYDFYITVLKTFEKEIEKTVISMRTSFDAHEVEEYRILVHGLKGSGGSAGATHLVELATRSNALIKEGKWDEATQYHEPIIKELERLIELIPLRISEHTA